MSTLDIRGLVAGYGDDPVLRGVDLHVPSGSTMAVLGESGSGKSTLLRAVAGIVAATSGSIEVDGRDVVDVPTHDRGVGMVFQHLALFPHADVATNVAFGLRSRGRSRADAERIVDGWLERVGLGGLGRRDVASLSGGQRQRVALVRALAAEPRVLLLDEPLGAVDAGLRTELLDLLRTLFLRHGTTVVHVTHDPAEAAAIAERVAVLHEGRIVQVARPHELWSAPASATVARLAGHPNVLSPEEAAGLGLGPAATPDRGALVVPPDAVAASVDGAGPGIEGRVVALAAGASWHATVAVDAGPRLVVRIDPARAPALGERVRLVVEAERIVHVPS